MDVLVQAHGAHAHLDASLFTTATSKLGAVTWSHEKAVASLITESRKSREIFILHLRQKYDEELPPLWATCELMTFGEFSKWLTNTQSGALRNQVARAYGLDESILVSFLHHLTVVRNLCAHHARLWNREFTLRWKLPRKNPADLVASLCPANHATLYNTLAMLGYLMDVISPNTRWKARVLALIDKHRIDGTHMGFPADYWTHPRWAAAQQSVAEGTGG